MTLGRLYGAAALSALLALGACSTVSRVGAITPFHGSHKKKEDLARAKANRIPVIALNELLAATGGRAGAGAP